MITVPSAFRKWIGNAHGTKGTEWLENLPGIVADLCMAWGLEVDGSVMHGATGIAVLVSHNDQACVLKISVQNDATRFEAQSLEHWDGRGMVQLLEHDPETGAMLLERLGPESLVNLPWQKGVRISGDLIRICSVEGLSTIPTVADTASVIALDIERRWREFGKPMARRLIDMARHTIEEQATNRDCRMVNKDIHFENVLAGTRLPWIAIDPMPLVGAPEFGVAQLLWRVIDMLESPVELRHAFDLLVDHGNLDRRLLRSWTLVRVADYWLWAIAHGLTMDPGRCETVIDWLEY